MPNSTASDGTALSELDSLLFESSPDCLTLLDGAGRLLAVNRNGQRAMEIDDFEPARGQPWPQLWPTDSRGLVTDALEAARAGRTARFEAFCPTAKGTPKWWHVTVTALGKQATGAACLTAFGRDITELRRARDAEQGSATRVRFVLEAAQVGEWELDLVTGQAATSLLHDRCFGYEQPVPEWTQQIFMAHLHPEDQAPVAREFEAARDLGRKLQFQCRVVWKDGSIHWISARGDFYPSGGTQSRRMLGTVQEVTQQVQAQARLRDSEARFRAMAETSPQLIWSTRPDGYHDYYNERWYEFTGVPQGSTDGEGWNGMFHPDDQDRAWARWRHCLATGDEYDIEYRLRHRSGEYRWVLGRALPVRDEARRITRWMGTCTEIHAHKTAQEALERSEESLRQADRRKDEFLAMLAHELRNPLAPIGTAAELLRRSVGDPQRVEQCSLIISRQVQHMTGLVNDLLDVSRVTRGLIELNAVTLDLKEAVHEAIEQVRPLVESRRHTLATRLPAAPLWVRGDRTRMIQVISNLLNNAAKYTRPGGEVMVEGSLSSGRAALQVRDSGEGIDAGLLPHIFELFTQAERNPDRAQGGLGIGLALVKSLVALHGGEITAESAGKGRGSSFTLSLPSAQPEHRTAAAGAALADIPAGTRRVIVVDDNADGAETLASLLQAVGHQVRTFGTGEAMIEALAGLEADTFILDIGLPGMTGHEIGRRLRQDPRFRHATIFALSGYGQEHDLAGSSASGFDRHFVKPANPALLLSALAAPAATTPAGPGSR